ncbi:hypothetical protein ALO97_200139 [Pseudomonas syringae pv. tagetis]|uniref:Uncharacterized protein n=1 Tax=Pseudomonas syringae pv. maculicola TaxID=59511 RepID=A0A3M6C729_PSEYM|nr:hypothetical protein ALP13_200054 [Pseudomonas syringae pv. maculicola]RMW18597.1 hypothetical protein ALO97_200139 [Pseudomonas syringae pv. tagetis]
MGKSTRNGTSQALLGSRLGSPPGTSGRSSAIKGGASSTLLRHEAGQKRILIRSIHFEMTDMSRASGTRKRWPTRLPTAMPVS